MILTNRRNTLRNWTKVIYTVMSKSFPTGRFKYLDAVKFNVNKCNYNSPRGCALEVDFEYLF